VDNDTCVWVFDVETELTGSLWDEIITVVDPGDLFYAVWANSYHYEPYYLDVLCEEIIETENEPILESLYMWIDQYYMDWETTIMNIAKHKKFNLSHCRVDLGGKTLYVVFKRRNDNEPFEPALTQV
jgi:hypothetical protein